MAPEEAMSFDAHIWWVYVLVPLFVGGAGGLVIDEVRRWPRRRRP